MTIAKTDSYYDQYWSGSTGWKPTDGLDKELMKYFLKHVPSGCDALDVGCGDGRRYGRWLIESHKVILSGVDVSIIAVEEAQRSGLDAKVIASADHLPFPDQRFEVVMCFEVFEHLMNPHHAAAEIARVLKPGGRLICSVPNCGHWRNRLEHLFVGQIAPGGSPSTSRSAPWRDPHIRFFSRRTLRSMLMESGFSRTELGALDLQWLNSIPIARQMTRWRAFKSISILTEAAGRMWPSMLAGRVLAVATKV